MHKVSHHILESLNHLIPMIFLTQLCVAGPREYCIDEPFEAKCSSSELITITSAIYGFMGIGRCVKFDFGNFGTYTK